MELYEDDTGYVNMHMIQTVVGMLGRNPRLQRIVRYSLQGGEYRDEDSESDEDSYERYVRGNENHFRDMSNGGGYRGNLPRSHLPAYRGPYYHPNDLTDSSVPEETEAERNGRLSKEMSKEEEKAEKKKLKRQNQKRKKQLEKGKQSAPKPDEAKSDAQQPTAGVNKPVKEKPKDDAGPSVEKSASAKDTESIEDEYSGDDSDNEGDSFEMENLDMNSSFVSKAALIAMRKVEKKPQAEKKEKKQKKEKKKVPVKESPTVPATTNEKPEAEQMFSEQDSAALSVPTLEDNIKLSTELAVIGNRFASSGNFEKAVEYFTHAIKYNPTEFKLFGNRSFCFEKMQQYERALADAEVCVALCPGWVKGEFRKGRALAGLKRYQEAARSFSQVLQLDGSHADAAQELMQMQIMQLMECGYTREQSSNALIIHGSVEKALAVLSNLNSNLGAFQIAPLSLAQVVNVGGVSPILSAANSPLKNKPLGPAQIVSNIQAQHKLDSNSASKTRSRENSQQALFPVWVGNLAHRVTESMVNNLFNKVGAVYSVKLLSYKCCAFVNFTKKEHCEEAIRRFNGFELNGMKMTVRYPDRIPSGLGISSSALKADDLQNENVRQSTHGSRQPARSPRPVPDHRDDSKK